MSLTRQQKYAIQTTKMFGYAERERAGKAYYYDDGTEKEFVVPQFSEILKVMFEKIKEVGIVEIKRCQPSEANCIIRVYQDLHHEYDWGMCFNVYGADCYIKVNGKWKTNDGIEGTPINFEKHEFRIMLMPDECLRVNADFVDCYVKIS